MATERTVITEVGELPETDTRFKTVEALPHDLHSGIHHVRFSAKFKTEARLEVESIAIQPFKDETTPHFHMGSQLEPDKLDDYITALELIRHQFLGGFE